MIRKGDTVRIKLEWQDAGDDDFQWRAVSDEEKGRVDISPQLGMSINPVQTVTVDMIYRLKLGPHMRFIEIGEPEKLLTHDFPPR